MHITWVHVHVECVPHDLCDILELFNRVEAVAVQFMYKRTDVSNCLQINMLKHLQSLYNKTPYDL